MSGNGSDFLSSLPLDDLTPSAATELLRHAVRYPDPPAARRVFVNRNLRLETIRYVGFDLDWTLADYERHGLEKLTFELTIDRLIRGHGYPESIRGLEFRPDFPLRGLLIDKQEGTVLRMNRHRYVGAAFLGRRRLDSSDLIRLYRHDPIDPASARFYHVDSLFELPETSLFAELVDRTQRAGAGLPDYPRLFSDVRSAIDWVHGEGEMKQRILAEPDRYLKRDPEIALALERLALGNRRLIMITNSPWYYVDGVSRYLLDGALPGGGSWRELFDLVIVDSAKPRFFRESRPFVRLDAGGRPGESCAVPEWGQAYSGGSLQGLMELLACRGDRVLYVGDHIYGDIVSSKRESTWRTALIVSELEEELDKRERHKEDIARLEALRRRLADLGYQMDSVGDLLSLLARLEGRDEALAAASRLLGERFDYVKGHHRALLHRAREISQRVSDAFNPYWGSFFKQGSSKSLFAAQLEAFACLYTSRVSNFSFYGSDHYFRIIEDPMQHEAD